MSNNNMTPVAGQNLTDTVNNIPADKKPRKVYLTREEKRLVRRCFLMHPDEFEDLAKGLHYVNNTILGWYLPDPKKTMSFEAMNGAVYCRRSNEQEQRSLERSAFYLYSGYDGRLWRASTAVQLAALLKAVRKDMKTRYDDVYFRG